MISFDDYNIRVPPSVALITTRNVLARNFMIFITCHHMHSTSYLHAQRQNGEICSGFSKKGGSLWLNCVWSIVPFGWILMTRLYFSYMPHPNLANFHTHFVDGKLELRIFHYVDLNYEISKSPFCNFGFICCYCSWMIKNSWFQQFKRLGWSTQKREYDMNNILFPLKTSPRTNTSRSAV